MDNVKTKHEWKVGDYFMLCGWLHRVIRLEIPYIIYQDVALNSVGEPYDEDVNMSYELDEWATFVTDEEAMKKILES